MLVPIPDKTHSTRQLKPHGNYSCVYFSNHSFRYTTLHLESAISPKESCWQDGNVQFKVFSSHNRAMAVLGMIKRSFKHIDVENFKILYNTYIRPHLEYCAQVLEPVP